MVQRLVAAGVALCAASVPAGEWPDPADVGARLLQAREAGVVDRELVGVAASARNERTRRMAVGLIASVASPSDASLLWRFVGDRDPMVREAVQVAAGRLGPEAAALVARGLTDADPRVRAAAVWAAAPLEDQGLMEALRQLAERETEPDVLRRLASIAGHVPHATARRIAERLTEARVPAVDRSVAFWLGRTGNGHAVLRSLAGRPDATTRAAAVAGLARGDAVAEDRRTVVKSLGDPDTAVRTAACSVLARRPGWELSSTEGEALIECLADGGRQLRAAAVRAVGRHAEVGAEDELQRLVSGPEPWLASLALEAMARRRPESVVDRVRGWLASAETWRREAAAVAAAQLDAVPPSWIESMLGDRSPDVRLAWLGAAPEGALGSARLERLIATDPDPAVRAVALELRGALGGVTVERWMGWYRQFAGDDLPDARAAAVLGALEAADSDEQRRGILAAAAQDAAPAVAAQVARRAWRHGLSFEASPRPTRQIDFYRDLIGWCDTPCWLDLVTVRGTIRVRVDAENAPITARRIWDLATTGFYDGSTFHRVVPNFVAQGGDPRGDGWGDGGVVLPDEPSLEPFHRGRLGIATSGPNTGGCQLFAMLQPAPHLDGRYTAFGRVTAGFDALDRLGEGDAIRRVETFSGPDPPVLTPTLVGAVTPGDLWELPGWAAERAAYRPDPAVMDEIHAMRPFVTVTVVLGTWCSDSRREVPRLLAVLEELEPSRSEVRMVGVDRSMLVPEGSVSAMVVPGRRVTAVPTIVVAEQGGGELGRVIEVAERPWEELLREFLEAYDGE